MRLSHPDYIKLVIEIYHKKRSNNELSLLLAQPTPASLRKESAIVYQERYERRDENALRAFFGSEEPDRKFIEIIQDFEIDKFRPLVSYLKKADKKGVNDTNLELLAWLINFRHRPYIFDKEVLLSDEELAILGKPVNSGGKKQTEPATEEVELEGKVGKTKEGDQAILQSASLDKKQKGKIKRAVILFLIMVICFGGGYTIWQEMQNNKMAPGDGNTGCMYWKGDRYEAMPCNEKRKGQLAWPMDPEKMKSFKKIMREDTITEKSVGIVHYLKINGGIEYYTEGGNHPIEVTRILKPLSLYMFDKYLRKQDNTNKDSVVDQKGEFVNNH